ncbi:MAG: hypothetical protein RIB47_08970 [Cyclobacteriaceae bacterium]
MERIVIVAYKPKEGKEDVLKKLVADHWNRLNDEGLVTPRKPVITQAADKTIVEVFGWKSKQAVEQAHANENVQKMWQEFTEACDYIPVGTVAEAENIFSEFTPLN